MVGRTRQRTGRFAGRGEHPIRHRWGFKAVLIFVAAILGGAVAAQEPAIETRPVAADSIIILEIRVEGNQRIEADTIRSYMGFKAGDVYDPASVDASLKALFATGLFADVTIRRQVAVLIVTVVENPIINRVAFEGNQAINDDDLTAEVQLQPRIVYTRAKVQSDVQRIIDLFRRAGRFSATVEPKVIQLPQNRIDLVFEINEGPVTGVEAINFIGNKAFSDGDLRGVISTSESVWWNFLSTSDRYDPDRLSFDRELLRRFYLSNGYADFRVVSAVADLSRDTEDFFLTFTVEEGEVYTFGDSTVTTSLDKLDTAALEVLVISPQGETYDASLIDESVDALTFAAGAQGYAFAEVRPRIRRDRENLVINIEYVIEEGPRVYVERININGNVRTLDRVIRRVVRMVEGDAFNRTLLEKSEGSIRALGFFAKVEVTEEPGSAPDKVVINIDVEEQSTGELSFGLGFSSTDNVVTDFSLTERNFMGKGQFLRLRLTLSGSRQQAEFRFTEPYFLNRNLAAGFDLFATETDFQDEASFDARTIGAGLRVGFPISENGRLGLRYSINREEIFNVSSNASLSVRSAEGEETRSIIGYSYFLDRRDDPVEPKNGWDFSIDQEFAGLGGTVKYLNTTSTARVFYEIEDPWLLTGRLEGGYIFALDDEDIRLNDRYFKGGNDFRGFERAGVGPRDTLTDDAVGAQAFAIGSIELGFPNFLPEAFGIGTSLFTDVGYIGIADESNNPFVEDDFAPRASAGISVYWESPFGPVRVDLSQVLLDEPFDEKETFRFSAGTRF